MTEKRQLILAVNALGVGHHEAAWRRHDAEPERLTEVGYFQELAQLAERGRFDLFFLADFMAYSPSIQHNVRWAIEPVSVLAAVAAVTEHIGLVATGSTTYTEAYNLARTFATFDHVTGGRAGWNIVTSGDPAVAVNFNRTSQVEHHDRYQRAHEFVEVVTRLWDSWSGDDVREIDHRGAAYSVQGPLNMPSPPQGYPVLVQAGSSEDGRAFAGRYAEVVFTAQTTLADGQAFSADIRSRARAAGRDPESVKILPGFSAVIGSTEAEARRLKAELDDLIVPEATLHWLSSFGVDLTGYPLDDPLPDELGDVAAFEGIRSRFGVLATVAERSTSMTIRQFATRLAGSRGHAQRVGTPEQIAADMELWLTARAADGFMVMPPHLPGGLADFVDHVVPELQRRGILRTEYTGATLRDRLGLSLPLGYSTVPAVTPA